MDSRPRDDPADEDISLRILHGKQNTAYYHAAEVHDDTMSINPDSTILIDQQSIRSDGSLKRGHIEKERLERPKIALNRNRATAFGHFLIFHSIPLVAAFALIIINIRTRYYGIDSKWISELQFAAKAHELFMQISIGAVMVAYLQYLLTRKSAVPFGAVFSAYNITQMSYLWSREFRGAVTASSFRGLIKIMFILFVPFSILLTAGVGPSSAIAMQPRQVNFTGPDKSIALNVTSDLLYPNTIQQPGPPLSGAEGNQNELSPATGWQYLRSLPSLGPDQGPESTTESGLQQMQLPNRYELVMPNLYTVQLPTFSGTGEEASSIRTLYVQYAPNSTFATVSHVPVALAMHWASTDSTETFHGYPGTAYASIEMPQGFASVLCELNTIMDENDTRPIQFPNTYVSGCDSAGNFGCDNELNVFNVSNYTGVTRRQIWDGATQSFAGQIIWLDDVQIASPFAGTSLGAIVVQPERCGLNDSFLTTSACVIGARWANATLFQETTSDGSSDFSGIAENDFTVDSPSTLPQWSQPSISLSKLWATSLNPLTATQNRTVADNLLRALPLTQELCPSNGTYPQETGQFSWTRPFMHEALLASLVANGLSYAAGATEHWFQETYGSGAWVPYGPNSNDKSSAVPPGLVMTFHARLPGYAWNLDGIPIKIALAILILYCGYAGTYVGYTFVSGRSSTTWSTISDLTALALGSTPPEGETLENASAGITRAETFRKPVSVREVEASERLELVFQREGKGLAYRRVAVGKAY